MTVQAGLHASALARWARHLAPRALWTIALIATVMTVAQMVWLDGVRVTEAGVTASMVLAAVVYPQTLAWAFLASRVPAGWPEWLRYAAVLGLGAALMVLMFFAPILSFFAIAGWCGYTPLCSDHLAQVANELQGGGGFADVLVLPWIALLLVVGAYGVGLRRARPHP